MKKYLLILLILEIHLLSYAQNEFRILDINNIKAGVNANGRLFTSPDSIGFPQFEVPKGDSIHAILQSNLLVSARDISGQIFVAAERDGDSDFYSGTINTDFIKYRTPIVKINKTEIDFHKANYSKTGYVVPDNIKYWPANGDSTYGEYKDLALFIDKNGNGYYDPRNGDYPFIKGDQSVYFIYNDIESLHFSTASTPLGIEIHAMVYGWKSFTDSNLNNTIFVDYTVVNRSKQNYIEMTFGQYMDFGLGNKTDNFTGCDSVLNMIYCYNSDSLDEDGALKGYGLNPPVVSMRYMSDSLYSFMSFGENNGVTGRPARGTEYFNYMRSKWRDGQYLTYGGTGYKPGITGVLVEQMFTGNPKINVGWTEFGSGNSGGHRSGITSIPRFSLKSGERKSLTIAFGYGRHANSTGNYLDNIKKSKNVLVKSKIFLDAQKFEKGVFATKWSPIPPSLIDSIKISVKQIKHVSGNKVKVYPNPIKSSFTIQSDKRLNRIQIIDFQGRIVAEVSLSNSSYNEIAFPLGLTSGMYLVSGRKCHNLAISSMKK